MRTGMSKRQIVEQVEGYKAQGLSTKDACAKVGIHFVTYYRSRKEMDHDGSHEENERLRRENSALWDLVKVSKERELNH